MRRFGALRCLVLRDGRPERQGEGGLRVALTLWGPCPLAKRKSPSSDERRGVASKIAMLPTLLRRYDGWPSGLEHPRFCCRVDIVAISLGLGPHNLRSAAPVLVAASSFFEVRLSEGSRLTKVTAASDVRLAPDPWPEECVQYEAAIGSMTKPERPPSHLRPRTHGSRTHGSVRGRYPWPLISSPTRGN